MIIGGPALTKYNDRTLRNLTTAPASATSSPGALVHIKTITASSDATISFVNGTSDVVLDNTYPIYKFELINIHPSADNRDLDFNVSIDTGSNYNVAKTTAYHYVYNNESNGIDSSASAGTEYISGSDLANGTGFQEMMENVGGDNDQMGTGEMWLFNPSSTTFVKHFMLKTISASANNYSKNAYLAGYANTTSAVDAVQFKFNGSASADIDTGKIKLYGIKDS